MPGPGWRWTHLVCGGSITLYIVWRCDNKMNLVTGLYRLPLIIGLLKFGAKCHEFAMQENAFPRIARTGHLKDESAIMSPLLPYLSFQQL